MDTYNKWEYVFDLLEVYGFFGFTEDPHYKTIKKKLLTNNTDSITREEYTELLGAIKSAESKLHKIGTKEARTLAYALRRILYHGREEGFEDFAELKDKYGGYYIATAVYGSYDAPQVHILRSFRDEYLEKRSWGRLLVCIYYKYSPSIAKHLSGKKKINNIIASIIERFL